MKRATIAVAETHWRVTVTTEVIIIHIFCNVDDRMKGQMDIVKHRPAKRYPSELGPIGILLALNGGHVAAFYRWLKRDDDKRFGGLPDRTRVQRRLAVHHEGCDCLLEQPSTFTLGDSDPIELLFPIRQGRSTGPLGKTGRDKGRWMIHFRLWWLLDTDGRVVEWYWLELSHVDHDFNSLTARFDGQPIALHDWGFRNADGLPNTIKIGKKGLGMNRCLSTLRF